VLSKTGKVAAVAEFLWPLAVGFGSPAGMPIAAPWPVPDRNAVEHFALSTVLLSYLRKRIHATGAPSKRSEKGPPDNDDEANPVKSYLQHPQPYGCMRMRLKRMNTINHQLSQRVSGSYLKVLYYY
jgi:hypothetical protein